MTKQKIEQVADALTAEGFKVGRWGNRLYVQTQTKDPAVLTQHGYVTVDGYCVDTTKCTSPRARAVARQRPQEPGSDANGSPVLTPPAEVVYAKESEREARASRIASLIGQIEWILATRSPYLDELLALVKKDTAQAYESIIAQRVADTVAQLTPKLRVEAREAALAKAREEREELLGKAITALSKASALLEEVVEDLEDGQ